MVATIATTQWSQVLVARDGSATEAREALETLCQTYWEPLYAYVRQRGSDPDAARDLTQGFFADLLARDFLADVDPAKGRFRAFLLASLRNYLSRQRDHEGALKRGGGVQSLSLDVESGEHRFTQHPIDGMTPESLFEHRWALTVLDRAIERLSRESTSEDDASRFGELRRYLTSPETDATYRQTAEELGMSEAAVKMAVHRLRKRYGECLRAEISETVADSADVDDEVRHLLNVVRFSPG